MKECSRCLTTETADTITFSPVDGVCSVCTQVEKKFNGTIDWAARSLEFDGIVSHAKDVAGKMRSNYDVVLPFSGGKDSTYQLWHVCTKTNLKPLVVRYNHWGYRPGVEANNIRTFRKLGVDVIDFRPNWRVVKLLMREALIRRGDTCLHCHMGVYSYPMHVALQHHIPLVLWGEALSEYQSFGLGEKESVDEVRFNRAMNLGMTAKDLATFLASSGVTERDLWPYAYPPKHELIGLGVQSICLGDYIRWDTKAQVEIIKRELGWEGAQVEGIPPEFDYEKIECYSQGVRDFSKAVKRGFGRTNHLANIAIRHGHMTREEGDRLQHEYDGKRPHSFGKFLEFLEMTEDEYMEILRTHQVDPWSDGGRAYETGPALADIDQWK